MKAFLILVFSPVLIFRTDSHRVETGVYGSSGEAFFARRGTYMTIWKDTTSQSLKAELYSEFKGQKLPK